jgi:hypothetical protein
MTQEQEGASDLIYTYILAPDIKEYKESFTKGNRHRPKFELDPFQANTKRSDNELPIESVRILVIFCFLY